MYLQLHQLTIHLQTTATAVQQQWRHWFDGWLAPPTAQPHGRLHLDLVSTLPPLPQTAVQFSSPHDQLTVYAGPNGRAWLHFHDGGLLSVPLTDQDHLPTISGYLTPNLLNHGRLEDLFFTSLAPFLRHHGYFLLHAFAAASPNPPHTAVLIVGPSGSGKTSSGLNLLLHGWQLLANDVVLLHAQADGLYALPTPSGITVRPPTFALLPELAPKLGMPTPTTAVSLNAAQFNQTQLPAPARIQTLLFPHIDPARPSCHCHPLNRAIALTQLMAESIDRWDATSLTSHIDHLQQLCQQTAVYQLQLGPDVHGLAALIQQTLSA